MSNDALRKKLDTAFAPYARGFCAQPNQAVITVSVDGTDATTFFEMSPADFAVIDGDPNLKSVITRAYAGLVRKVSDGARNPILMYSQR
ncbi:MAG TPA: hypothetical protein ENK57_18625 [Polyangiaceae bacterium]|nr:hypothetical protein [Polyangiaceae bacterium]